MLHEEFLKAASELKPHQLLYITVPEQPAHKSIDLDKEFQKINLAAKHLFMYEKRCSPHMQIFLQKMDLSRECV